MAYKVLYKDNGEEKSFESSYSWELDYRFDISYVSAQSVKSGIEGIVLICKASFDEKIEGMAVYIDKNHLHEIGEHKKKLQEKLSKIFFHGDKRGSKSNVFEDKQPQSISEEPNG